MSRSDAFVATVGTLLIENTPCQPWRAPVPPALAVQIGPTKSEARGWYVPTPSGPRCIFIWLADGKPAEAVEAAIAQWQTWVETLHADESVLFVTWEDGAILDEANFALPEDGPWPVWLVDLAAQAVVRPTVPDDGQPFLVLADTLLATYFSGTHFSPSDLTEQEKARLSGRPPFSRFLHGRGSPATWVLLAILAVIFGLTELAGGSTKIPVMLKAGVNYRPLIEDGQWWRLISANFLHFGWMHIALNAYSLFAVGPMLEKIYGTSRYLAIYVFAGVTGAIASMYLNGNFSAGASGALFGLIGTMLFTGIKHQEAIPGHVRKDMRNIALVTLAINLAYGFSQPQIDNWAHLGGLAGGFALAALLGPSPSLLGKHQRRLTTWLLAAFPAIAAVGLACSLVYWAQGRVPEELAHGPGKSYSVRVPLERSGTTKSGDVFVLSEDRNHWIGLHGRENPFKGTAAGKPALTEATLEVYQRELGTILAEGDRLVGPPRVVTRGRHRFVEVAIAGEEGKPEAAYATASKDRIFQIRTNGLQDEPWMRPTLDRVLDTFDYTP